MSPWQPYLDLLERARLLLAVVQGQEAVGLTAARVVLHAQGDGPPRLGAAPHLVELKAHEGLDERALAARLLAHDQDGRGVEGLLEVLRQAVQQVVRLVQLLLLLLAVRLAAAVVRLREGRERDEAGLVDYLGTRETAAAATTSERALHFIIRQLHSFSPYLSLPTLGVPAKL